MQIMQDQHRVTAGNEVPGLNGLNGLNSTVPQPQRLPQRLCPSWRGHIVAGALPELQRLRKVQAMLLNRRSCKDCASEG